MYPNLKAEIARKGTESEFALNLGWTKAKLSDTLKRKRVMTYDDAVLIKTTLGVTMPLDDLFMWVEK